jgi:hypothetical protein
MRILIVAGLAACLASAAAAQTAEDADAGRKPAQAASPHDICETIARSAAENGLPVEFFARLIWQESRFNPRAVSRAGAQGIAQFMPGTASWRGLADPFDPLEALKESAAWLGELRRHYGNLGLAAAAYNAGPGRVQNWLAGRGGLPGETRAYVRIVTGRPAEDWAAPEPPPAWEAAAPKGLPCMQLARVAKLFAAKAAAAAGPPPRPAAWAPWGVQLAGDWTAPRALANFRRLQQRHASLLGGREPLVVRVSFGRRAFRHLVRVAEPTRAGADQLCARLRSAGGACAVLRNPGRAIADSVSGRPSS